MEVVALLTVRETVCRLQNFVSLPLSCILLVARQLDFEKLVMSHPQFRAQSFPMASCSNVVGELVARMIYQLWNIVLQMLQSTWHSRMNPLFCRAASDVCNRSMLSVFRCLRGGKILQKAGISRLQIFRCVVVLVSVSLIPQSTLALKIIHFVQQLHWDKMVGRLLNLANVWFT